MEAQDGGYPNDNTAEGAFALHNLIIVNPNDPGANNTAIGSAALTFDSSGNDNTAIGFGALNSNVHGSNNTANGFDALLHNDTDNNTATGSQALQNNIAGINNTATGSQALFNNTTINGVSGFNNTADGTDALFSNTTGFNNTASGFTALQNNTIGNSNTAEGDGALASNTTGSSNTANGVSALESNATGSFNTATGSSALQNNNADNNTANGYAALNSNTTGTQNTANGEGALQSNTTGSFNTATGLGALNRNTTASNNVANGYFALSTNTIGHDNTAEGFKALLHNTGSSNIALGSNAGVNLTTGSNNINIGNGGVAGEAAKIRIGTVGTQKATFIAGIRGVTVAGGVGIIVGTNGQLGTTTSSARFKDEIKPMDKASEAILALQPVTFRYKHELDPDGIPQFGLVAEQVEKVNPDLVARDADGKVYTVRYEAVNAMLLNEFLKEHKKVEEQQATNTQVKSALAKQEATIAALTATVREQASQIQKVSDELELSKAARQLVADKQ